MVWSCHIFFWPAAQVELSFAGARWAATDPVDAGTRRVVQEGFVVIVDKDGLLRRLMTAAKTI